MHPLTRILILVSLFQLGCLGNAHEQVPIKSEADLREPVYDGKTPGQHQDSPKNIMNPASGPEEISIPTNLEDGQPAQLDTVESPTAPSFPWLVTSPYTSQGHLTNLSALPLPSRLFALSLTRLSPVGRSYATTPYQQAFNWPTVFENLRSVSASHNLTWTSTVFYVVEFRSKLKSNIDRELLFKLDRESHREATASGGLLKYWFGKVSDDKEGRNLATCLWVKKEDAMAGGKGPWHKRARGSIPRMYDNIDVRGLKLTIGDDVNHWQFEPWIEKF